MKKKTKQTKTTKVEKRTRKINLKAAFWAVIAIFALVVAILLIVLLNQPGQISEDYFVSDDTKIVMSMDSEIAALENSEYEPEITRLVYFHNGKEVTGVKVYYEYENEEKAREAFDNISIDRFATGKTLSGKYIVMQAKSETYEGLLADEMKAQVESMKAAGALVDDVEEIEEVEEAEVEESAGE